MTDLVVQKVRAQRTNAEKLATAKVKQAMEELDELKQEMAQEQDRQREKVK